MCSWELSACFPMGTGNKEGKIYCNSYFFAKHNYQPHSLIHFHCECGSEGLRLLALMGVHHHGSKSSLGFHRSTSVAKFVRHLQSARMLQSFSWDGGSEDRMTDSVIPSAFPCSICCVGMWEDLVFFHLQHVLCLTHVLGSTVA